ncbi:MAG: T9SS type A sorting domain-containing protein [Ginsengibacter sp.]
MKKGLLMLLLFLSFFSSKEQVTQVNSNKDLTGIISLTNTALFESTLDSSLWVSDGTPVGTVQISDTIKYIGYGSMLNNKFIFKGISPNCGKEIFITDGTAAGTKLIKDINPGTANSQPIATTMAVLNNNVYFAAVTSTLGCELWKTDGTAANTTNVKDIVSGTGSGIDTTAFSLVSNGTNLLFDGHTATEGNELWISGGTSATTSLLKDINSGATSSSPRGFFPLGSNALFTVTSADGLTTQVWRTNGTAGGTIMLISNITPAFGIITNSTFTLFHNFGSRAYCLINDGTHTGDAFWSTDGTDATSTHTTFIKTLSNTFGFASFLIVDAVNLSSKFIFPYSDGSTIFSLYESDGTSSGTKSFHDFPVNVNGNVPEIYLNTGGGLYNGYFYFTASDVDGNELYKSDGSTIQLVQDINPGSNDGITSNQSYLFTSSYLFFAADNGTNGDELWKTDGTTTSMVYDIFPNHHNGDPALFFVNNGHLFFGATDASPADSSLTDLFVVDGTFSTTPVKLLNFTATCKGNDALLQWATAQEINTKDFTVQSSTNAINWIFVGTVDAKRNSNQQNNYSFIDPGVINSSNMVIYYRLITNDLDGKQSFSNIVLLKIGNEDQWTARIMNNPVNNILKISFDGLKQPALLSIHDLNGRELYRNQVQAANGITSVPLNIQAGVYILQIRSDNQTKTMKFVKE